MILNGLVIIVNLICGECEDDKPILVLEHDVMVKRTECNCL